MTRSKTKPKKQSAYSQEKNTWSLQDETQQLLMPSNVLQHPIPAKSTSKKYDFLPTSFHLHEDFKNNIYYFIKSLKISVATTNITTKNLQYIITFKELSTMCLDSHSKNNHKEGKCPNCIPLTFEKKEINFQNIMGAIKNNLLKIKLVGQYMQLFLKIDETADINKHRKTNIMELHHALCHLKCLFPNESSEDSIPNFSNMHNVISLQTTFDHLLEKNKLFIKNHKPEIIIAHENMHAKLRNYQTNAVIWMLEQETKSGISKKFEYFIPYDSIKNENGCIVGYINAEMGLLSSRSIVREIIIRKNSPGGILADEMGLGKTVETICCILLNPRISYENFNLNYTAIYLENKEYILKLYANLPKVLPVKENCDTLKLRPPKKTASLRQLKNFSKCQKQFIDVQELIINAMIRCKGKIKSQSLYCSTCTVIPKYKITLLKKNFNIALKKLIGKECIAKAHSLLRGKQVLHYTMKKNTMNSFMDTISKKIIDFKNAYDEWLVHQQDLEINDDSSVSPEELSKTETEHDLHCICGENSHDQEENPIIQCSSCTTYQHQKCVQYFYFFNNYLCPHCSVLERNIIKCKSTLIISPLAIYEQWMSEINFHVKANGLKVFCYKGIKSTGTGYTQPYVLSQYDVVIATYATLRNELYNTNLPHHGDKKLRQKKVYMATPSPLLALQWWRVCLDESQMIGSAAANASKMAAMLPSINRWCITGTPISNDLDDLYGQICFLNVQPITNKPLWTRIIAEPFTKRHCDPLLKVLEMIMWRNTKANVHDELDLPPLVEVEHILTNSNIEKYFYKKIHDTCKADVQNYLLTKNTDENNSSEKYLNQLQLTKVVHSLKKLRQACCDPSITNYFGNVSRYNININRCITMDVLLENLIKKCVNECEESLRQSNAARNGIAGVYLLENKDQEAVDLYRETLKVSASLKDQVRTDPLQTLHVAYNLNQLLQAEPERYGRTLRDDDLVNICKEIEKTYAKRHIDILTTKHQQFESTKLSCSLCVGNPYYKASWWDNVIQCAVNIGTHDDLLKGINSAISTIKSRSVFTTTGHFSTFSSLSYVLNKEVDALFAANKKLTSLMEHLYVNQSNHNFQSAASLCHLRPIEESMKGSCELCTAEMIFNTVESKLFSPGNTTTLNEGANMTTGLKARGYAETILITILAFAKRHKKIQAMSDLVQYGDVHLDMFDNMKKLYNIMHGLWTAIQDNVAAVDELKMAKTRLQLANNVTESNQNLALNLIYQSELCSTKISCQADLEYAKEMLNTRLGQLRYLKNLATFEKQDSANDATRELECQDQHNNLRDCPICTNEFGLYWVMHQCGHCYCVKCNEKLIKSTCINSQQVQCAICRGCTWIKDISYVTSRKETISEDEIPIVGNNSTKITGVIRQLLKLANCKVLLFSSWTKMLDILSDALIKNKIKHKLITSPSSHTFNEDLKCFKSSSSDTNVLLMPINIGGKGLNIIEAKHVFIVEPILSKAVELQAVGRAHRLGQTQRVTVHKFYIQETIEEKLYKMMKKVHSSPSYNPASVKNTSDEKMLAEISVEEIRQIFY